MVKITSKSATAASANGTPTVIKPLTKKQMKEKMKKNYEKIKKIMEEKMLWRFFFFKWAKKNYHEDVIFYEGKFGNCSKKFISAVAKGFVFFEHEMNEEFSKAWMKAWGPKPTPLTPNIWQDLSCLKKDYPNLKVFLYFNPEDLLSKMHYLSRDEMGSHYTALKKRGWIDDDLGNILRNILRTVL